ncbi:MAG TPA: FHA domain-containing protein [Gemmataceae bacterium]|nr:FHA domain-containing protein [Gemmataceae bacterium]
MPAGANLNVTFQVVDGVDKGRVFRGLPVPLTIGREEGNLLRLNDERVSRFHAKIQQDGSDLILTDLESTNGTRVNGHVVQIRRLRFGDRIALGRSLLLFGSDDEINERRATLRATLNPLLGSVLSSGGSGQGPPTVQANTVSSQMAADCDFDLNIKEDITVSEGELFVGKHALPPLPQKLSPSQAARLAEILDFLHHHLTQATEHIRANEDGTQVTLSFDDWQGVLAVQNLLARYLRAVAEPDALEH